MFLEHLGQNDEGGNNPKGQLDAAGRAGHHLVASISGAPGKYYVLYELHDF